jgi:uncharacterized protein YjcR
MDVISINQKILEASTTINEGARMIFEYAKASAKATTEYDKAYAFKIQELMEKKVPVTVIKEVAKGEIADLKFKMDLQENLYDACKRSLSAQEAQLSALQSILKYQSEV